MGLLIGLLVTGILVWIFALIIVPGAAIIMAGTAADNSPVARFVCSILFAILVAVIVVAASA